MDFTRATALTPDVEAAIDDAFDYHPWDREHQIEAGKRVRAILGEAVKVIVRDVPPCPDRTTAIRKLRSANVMLTDALARNDVAREVSGPPS